MKHRNVILIYEKEADCWAGNMILLIKSTTLTSHTPTLFHHLHTKEEGDEEEEQMQETRSIVYNIFHNSLNKCHFKLKT